MCSSAARYRQSTHTGNKELARNIETADRNALVKGEHGIATPSRIPTFRTFAETFLVGVETDAERPRTIQMYRTAVKGLLAFPRLSGARLDRIDLAMVDAFKQWKHRQVSRRKKPFSPETINLQLRVLRVMLGKALGLKHIREIPKVRRVGGKRERDFVLRDDEPYLETGASRPLLLTPRPFWRDDSGHYERRCPLEGSPGRSRPVA